MFKNNYIYVMYFVELCSALTLPQMFKQCSNFIEGNSVFHLVSCIFNHLCGCFATTSEETQGTLDDTLENEKESQQQASLSNAHCCLYCSLMMKHDFSFLSAVKVV